MASKVGEFKILTYRRSLILAISQFNDLKRLLSTLIGAAFNGKNMLPIVNPVFFFYELLWSNFSFF